MIIGSGFGGIRAAKGLAGVDVDVTIIDVNNFHTFQPLLYQVATAGLDADDIGFPIRGIFRRSKSVRFVLGEVTGIDLRAPDGHDSRWANVRLRLPRDRCRNHQYVVRHRGSRRQHVSTEDAARRPSIAGPSADSVRDRERERGVRPSISESSSSAAVRQGSRWPEDCGS